MEYFYKVVSRDSKPSDFIPVFINMWNKDPNICLKLIMNFRDIGCGKGEKMVSRVLLFCLKICKYSIYQVMVKQIIESIGTWKDLLYICEYTIKYRNICEMCPHPLNNNYEFKLFADQLKKDIETLISDPNAIISLASKWAPSEKTHYNNNKLLFANKIANVMKLTPREYRKLLVLLRSKIKTNKLIKGEWVKGVNDYVPNVVVNKYDCIEKYSIEEYKINSLVETI